jgi:hypothetical protein
MWAVGVVVTRRSETSKSRVRLSEEISDFVESEIKISESDSPLFFLNSKGLYIIIT